MLDVYKRQVGKMTRAAIFVKLGRVFDCPGCLKRGYNFGARVSKQN